ncbi:MAG: hypothetical protein R3C53_25530 [Pirellulaceae bacterium]
MHSLFDELSFSCAALPINTSAAELDTTFTIPTMGSQRRLQVGMPWFVRHPKPKWLGKQWPVLCGLLRSAGIPIYGPVEHLADVPAASLPLRFATRQNASPFNSLEMKTADALEICLRPESDEAAWSWPSEFGQVTDLANFVQTVRVAAGGNTPIGVSLPVGAANTDLEACLAAQVDFLTFVADPNLDDEAVLIEGLTRARRRIEQADRALPILLVAHPRDVGQCVKLLALGASCLSIDSLLESTVDTRPAQPVSAGGMLSGISLPTPQTEPSLAKTEALLDTLANQLRACMQRTGAHDLAAFRANRLRCLTDHLSQLSGLTKLGHHPT